MENRTFNFFASENKQKNMLLLPVYYENVCEMVYKYKQKYGYQQQKFLRYSVEQWCRQQSLTRVSLFFL